MRPILSVIGTINYNVSKFFIPLLKKLTINEYTIQNTFTFIGELMTISNANDYVLASFDVSNLFTNVPLDETLSIIMDSLFDNVNEIQGLNKINKKKNFWTLQLKISYSFSMENCLNR